MDADNISEGHGEEAIGIILAQIPPTGKGQAAEVCQRPDRRGVHAGLTQTVAVKGDILVSPIQGRLQSLELELGQLIPILTLHISIPDLHFRYLPYGDVRSEI
jgi:hypothetical protein